MNDNYILIEEIKGNKDLHEIAKKIHFENGMGIYQKLQHEGNLLMK